MDEKRVRCIDCKCLQQKETGGAVPKFLCTSGIWERIGRGPHMIGHDPYSPIRCDHFETDGAASVKWHPIETRPLTDEELRYYYDTYGADSVPDSMLCGKMPEDDQMILITYRMKNGDLCVAVDTCTCDEWGYYLEDFEDFDRVIAWAPLPEPYKPKGEGEQNDGRI